MNNLQFYIGHSHIFYFFDVVFKFIKFFDKIHCHFSRDTLPIIRIAFKEKY